MSYQSKLPSQINMLIEDILAISFESPPNISKNLGLRASGLPFCSLKFFLNLPTLFVGEKMDTSGLFFVNVGTTVHELYQKGVEHVAEELSRKGMTPIADWECKHCGHVQVFTKKPTDCEFCRHHHFIMNEHTLAYRQLTGHVDNVFYMEQQKKYLIIDYKTATVKKVTAKEKAVFNNTQQIGTYVAIKAHEGYPMIGWALLYITRNSPWQWYPVIEENLDNEACIKRLDRYCDQHEAILLMEEVGDKEWNEVIWKNRMCKTKEHIDERAGYCKFAGLCRGCLTDDSVIQRQRKAVVTFLKNKLPLSQYLNLEHRNGYEKIR